MHRRYLAVVLLLPMLAGCLEDDPLNPPDLASSNGLLRRYVAMGNSITAGFQSDGINLTTQRQSYAALFANAAGAPFFAPELALPGCPPPLVNNTTGERLGGAAAPPCALRAGEQIPYVSNVAVPGAEVSDLLDNLGPGNNANELTTFILGGRTQVEAMEDAQPTFVSLWIGNNDVLGALTSSTDPGDEALITPADEFAADYTAVLDRIEATGAEAALIGVVNVAIAPFASTGSTYWCLKTGLCPGVAPAPFPPTFTVATNCAPAAAVPGAQGDNTLVPWPIGIGKIGAAAEGAPTTLDCSVDAEVSLPDETAALVSAVEAYNAHIAQEAAARGWAYLDPNPALAELRAAGEIPAFPDISELATGGPVLFGPYISLDGVHPSAAAHELVAELLIAEVNETYGTEIGAPQPAD